MGLGSDREVVAVSYALYPVQTRRRLVRLALLAGGAALILAGIVLAAYALRAAPGPRGAGQRGTLASAPASAPTEHRPEVSPASAPRAVVATESVPASGPTQPAGVAPTGPVEPVAKAPARTPRRAAAAHPRPKATAAPKPEMSEAQLQKILNGQ